MLSCLLALGLALIQGGMKLAAQGGAAGNRGVLLAALGVILAGLDFAGIFKFIHPPSHDD